MSNNTAHRTWVVVQASGAQVSHLVSLATAAHPPTLPALSQKWEVSEQPRTPDARQPAVEIEHDVVAEIGDVCLRGVRDHESKEPLAMQLRSVGAHCVGVDPHVVVECRVHHRANVCFPSWLAPREELA